MAGEGAYGLWQVLRQPQIPPVLRGPVVADDDTVTVRAFPPDFSLLERPPVVLAADGNPAVAQVEVRKLGVVFEVSRELMAQDGEMRRALERVMSGLPPFPESYMWRVVEQRKDLAASARLTYDRLVLAARRLPDSLAYRLICRHQPCTHERGALLTQPVCVLCGDDERSVTQYPCPLVQTVADVAGLPID